MPERVNEHSTPRGHCLGISGWTRRAPARTPRERSKPAPNHCSEGPPGVLQPQTSEERAMQGAAPGAGQGARRVGECLQRLSQGAPELPAHPPAPSLQSGNTAQCRAQKLDDPAPQLPPHGRGLPPLLGRSPSLCGHLFFDHMMLRAPVSPQLTEPWAPRPTLTSPLWGLHCARSTLGPISWPGAPQPKVSSSQQESPQECRWPPTHSASTREGNSRSPQPGRRGPALQGQEQRCSPWTKSMFTAPLLAQPQPAPQQKRQRKR